MYVVTPHRKYLSKLVLTMDHNISSSGVHVIISKLFMLRFLSGALLEVAHLPYIEFINWPI